MPDAAQMSGVPLPAPELPNATVTVRAGARAHGQQRARPRGDAGHARRPRLGVTDAARPRAVHGGAGRVRASPPRPSVDGETLRSQEFPVPAGGGVRVALVAGIAKAAAADGGGPGRSGRPPGAARRGRVRCRIRASSSSSRTICRRSSTCSASSTTPARRSTPASRWCSTCRADADRRVAGRRTGDHRADAGPAAHPDRAVPAGADRLPGGLPAAAHLDDPRSSRRGRRRSRALLVAAEKVGGLTMSSPQLTAQREGESNGQTFVMGTAGRLAEGQPLDARVLRACRRRRPGRATSRSAWPACWPLWAAWAAWHGAPDAHVDAGRAGRRARAAARRHRRHRRRAAGARRRRPAGRGQARPARRRGRAGLRRARSAARRTGTRRERRLRPRRRHRRRAPLRPPAGAGRHLVRRPSRGDIVGLLGPNGAGKSTLLAILGDAAGARRRAASTTARRRRRRRRGACAPRIGMLGHDLFLYPELTARENLVFFGRLYGVADAPARGGEALERAGLAARADDAGVGAVARHAPAGRARAGAAAPAAAAAARRAVHRPRSGVGGGAGRRGCARSRRAGVIDRAGHPRSRRRRRAADRDDLPARRPAAWRRAGDGGGAA